MVLKNTSKLIISLAIPLTVGAISGYFTAEAIPGWYESLQQPTFNPPNKLFGPVWTTLYILMGFSCYLIWKEPPGRDRNVALTVYSVQLVLNSLWSFLFFYFKRIDLALFEIALLWIGIVVMLLAFRKVKPLAAYLNVPYLLWVTFASILNTSYFLLNN